MIGVDKATIAKALASIRDDVLNAEAALEDHEQMTDGILGALLDTAEKIERLCTVLVAVRRQAL